MLHSGELRSALLAQCNIKFSRRCRNGALWNQHSSQKSCAIQRYPKLRCASDNLVPIRIELEDGSILFKFNRSHEGPRKTKEEVISELKELQKSHEMSNSHLTPTSSDESPNTTTGEEVLTPSKQWTKEQLSDMTVRDLRQLCREHEIRGVSNLRKADLITVMLDFENNDQTSKSSSSSSPAEC